MLMHNWEFDPVPSMPVEVVLMRLDREARIQRHRSAVVGTIPKSIM